MKILYSHYLTDAHHPAAQMVHHISHHLRKLGHDVEVHASAGIKDPQSDILNDRLPERTPWAALWKRNIWFAKAMARNRGWMRGDRRAIQDFQPDIILTRQDAYSWSAVKAATEAKVPCVIYADAPVAYETRQFNCAKRWHPPGLVESIEKWGIRHSEAVITISRPAARRLRSYGLDVPIHVNHNGVDATIFQAIDETEKQAIRSSLGITTSVVVGFQGSFRAFHGIDRLRELILSTRNTDEVTWLLIGDGPERMDIERDLKKKANAIFLGKRPHEEMNKLLSIVDIAVAPHSLLEGDFYFCPLKILEYAASGCAVIASHQGDIPKLLDDGKAGVIVHDDELSSWTMALDRLIENKTIRREYGRRGREFVMKSLTWENTARRVEKILADVLSSNSPHDTKSKNRNCAQVGSAH